MLMVMLKNLHNNCMLFIVLYCIRERTIKWYDYKEKDYKVETVGVAGNNNNNNNNTVEEDGNVDNNDDENENEDKDKDKDNNNDDKRTYNRIVCHFLCCNRNNITL